MTAERDALAALVAAWDSEAYNREWGQRMTAAIDAARVVLAAQPDNDQSGGPGIPCESPAPSTEAQVTSEQAVSHAPRVADESVAQHSRPPDPTAAPAQGEPREPVARPVSDDEIIAIRDSMLPSQGESFDCLAFAHAIILAVVNPSPAQPAAQPAEPPATDADRLVHDLRAIAIDFAGDHQVDNTCRAAADLIERQAREIADERKARLSLREELSGERDRHKRTTERAERAEAERDRANADAARYRWLRGDAPEHSERWMRWCLQRWDGKCWHSLERAALDAAIDAARAKVQP